MFNRINNQQYIWYNAQLVADEEEKFELLRDVAEHNAMFTNPEGVNKVRESRKNTYETSDEDFSKMVEGLFGRPLPQKGETNRSEPLDPYLDMDLDEVYFTPIRGSD